MLGVEGSQQGVIPEFIEFSVNPLLSQIVLWNDADICDQKPGMKEIDIGLRVAWSCAALKRRGVASVASYPAPMWSPTKFIEHDSLGSAIADPASYRVRLRDYGTCRSDFAEIMEKQFKRRLEFIIGKSVVFFRATNLGYMKISSVNSHGLFLYRTTKSGRAFLRQTKG